LRTNGLTVARLAPYPGWLEFEGRVQNIWKIWRKHAGAHQMARIGVRFVNRIDIPSDGATPIAVESYLNFNVRSPANNLPPMANFQIQSSYASPDTGFTITLNSAPVPSPLVNHLSIVLDIDIGIQIGTIISDSEMWQKLQEMRKLKNQIFEDCITDQARKLFS
jgi:uncharacterized protein (TIGR04255 family)